VAISDTATQKPQHAKGPKYQYKTQTHNGTQTKSIQETTQRFGNWLFPSSGEFVFCIGILAHLHVLVCE